MFAPMLPGRGAADRQETFAKFAQDDANGEGDTRRTTFPCSAAKTTTRPVTMEPMDAVSDLVELPAELRMHLDAEDDAFLWAVLLQVVAEEITGLKSAKRFFMDIGCCSHWIRPHHLRWPASGSFSMPHGYGDGEGMFIGGLPEYDWSVTLHWVVERQVWAMVEKVADRRFIAARLAVPSRTTRHAQASVHSIWARGRLEPRQKQTVFYGFEKTSQGWSLAGTPSTG